MLFDRPYVLAPAGGSVKAYRLLAAVMEDTGRAGIATFVMRGKEYLTALRADDGVLALETLFFADEIRNPAEQLDTLPHQEGAARGKELEMAEALIKSMSGSWRPQDYRDTYTERVEQLIDDKRRGREIVTAAEPPEPTEMSDLLEALQRSISSVRDGERGRKVS